MTQCKVSAEKDVPVKKQAMFVVKRGATTRAAIVIYDQARERKGKVLVYEEIRKDFGLTDLAESARRLVPRVPDYDVILPTGIEL